MNEKDFMFRIIERTPAMVCRIRSDGATIYVNSACEKITGYKPEELIGRNWWKTLYPGEEYRQVEKLFIEFAGGDVHDHEMVLTTRYGERRRISWSSFNLLDESGGLKEVVGFGADITERRKIEEELRQSEEKCRTLLNEILSGFANHKIVTDENGRPVDYIFLEVNNAFERLTGLKKKDIIGRRVTEVLPGIGRDEFDWIGTYGRVALTGEEVKFEQYSEKLDRWYHFTAYRTELDHFSVIFDDITDRKRVEEAIRESEEHFRTLVENIPGAVFRCALDDEWTMLFLSDAIEDIVGYPPSDFLNNSVRSFDSIIHPHDREMVRNRVLEEVNKKRPFEKVYRLIDAADNVHWVFEKGRGIYSEEGKVLWLDGVLYDITERKHMEEALEENERFLNDVLDGIQDGISILDKDLNILRTNRIMEEMYAHQVPMLGRKCYDVYHGRKVPCEVCPTIETLKSGEKDVDIVPYTTDKGIKGWLTLHTFPMFDSKTGEVTGVIEHVRDITELKQKEEELQKSNRELEEFAAVVSHDLQSPLISVLSALKLLRHGCEGKLGREAEEYINYAAETIRNMISVVRSLLDYSRVDKFSGKFKTVDTRAVLDQSIANLMADITESGAMVTHNILPYVLGDDALLVLLFQNLISNAIKYRGVEPPRIHISAEKKTNEWLFSVRDNGMGIAKEDTGKIFEIYFSLKAKGELRGTGIGLATCKKIVEFHGGQIWVESELGKGSIFHFQLLGTDNNSQKHLSG